MMPHSFSVRLEPDDARWIRARSAVMAVHESNFHAPCCEACGKEWGKTVPTEADGRKRSFCYGFDRTARAPSPEAMTSATFYGH